MRKRTASQITPGTANACQIQRFSPTTPSSTPLFILEFLPSAGLDFRPRIEPDLILLRGQLDRSLAQAVVVLGQYCGLEWFRHISVLDKLRWLQGVEWRLVAQPAEILRRVFFAQHEVQEHVGEDRV